MCIKNVCLTKMRSYDTYCFVNCFFLVKYYEHLFMSTDINLQHHF